MTYCRRISDVITVGTFRGFSTDRARLDTYRGFGTERARLGTFRSLAQNVLLEAPLLCYITIDDCGLHQSSAYLLFTIAGRLYAARCYVNLKTSVNAQNEISL